MLPGVSVCKTRGLEQIISGSDVCTIVVLVLLNLLLLLNMHDSEQLLRPLFLHTLMQSGEEHVLLKENVIIC